MAAGDTPIRVLISDDHTLFREGIIEILAREPDLTVVGDADSGMGAIALTERTSPDVVVLDVEMPGPGAEETIRGILGSRPAVRIIVLTMHDDPNLVERLLARVRTPMSSRAPGARSCWARSAAS